jgi:hypothetical protein
MHSLDDDEDGENESHAEAKGSGDTDAAVDDDDVSIGDDDGEGGGDGDEDKEAKGAQDEQDGQEEKEAAEVAEAKIDGEGGNAPDYAEKDEKASTNGDAGAVRKDSVACHASAESVEQYEFLLDMAWSDGQVDPAEADRLEGARKKYGVSIEQHEQCLRKLAGEEEPKEEEAPNAEETPKEASPETPDTTVVGANHDSSGSSGGGNDMAAALLAAGSQVVTGMSADSSGRGLKMVMSIPITELITGDIEELDFSQKDTKLGVGGIMFFADYWSRFPGALHTLELRGNRVCNGDAAAKILCTAVAVEASNLRRLNGIYIEGLEEVRFRNREGAGGGMMEYEALFVAHRMRYNSTITKVTLPNMRLSHLCKWEQSIREITAAVTPPLPPVVVEAPKTKKGKEKAAKEAAATAARAKHLTEAASAARDRPLSIGLTSLDLRGNKIKQRGSRAIAAMLETNTTLTELQLSKNDVSRNDKLALGRALLRNPKTALRYFSCNEWEVQEGDVDLDLAGKELGPEDAILLAGLLQANDAITRLNLVDNSEPGLGSEGCRALAKVLNENNTTLEALGIDKGRIKVAQIKKDQMSNLTLQGCELGMGAAIVLSSIVNFGGRLVTLDLAENLIGPVFPDYSADGISAIANAIKAADHDFEGGCTIGTLNLAKNNLVGIDNTGGGRYTKNGLHFLCEVLKKNTSIRNFDVSSNQIPADAGVMLGELLLQNMVITTIKLKDNPIASGTAAIANGLSHNRGLTCVDLRATEMDDVGAALVGQALVKNRQLGFIALSYPWERKAEEEDEEEDAEAIAEALIASSSALQKEKKVEADKGMVLDCINSKDSSDDPEEVERKKIPQMLPLSLIRGLSNIFALDLKGLQLGPNDCIAIMTVLAKNLHVLYVDLSDNCFGGEDGMNDSPMEYIKDCLYTNHTIRSVDLSFNWLEALTVSSFEDPVIRSRVIAEPIGKLEEDLS